VIGPELQRDTATAEKPASSSTASSRATQMLLSIDGTVVGPVAGMSGGGVQAEVVTQAKRGGEIAKHLGSVQYEPITLQLGLGMDTAFFSWLRESLTNNVSPRNMTLHLLDESGHEKRTVEYKHAP
jgi:phage tail-like protein